MTGKYTILIDPALHRWFKHIAIDRECTVSALVAEAMETYKTHHDQRVADETFVKVKVRKIPAAAKLPSDTNVDNSTRLSAKKFVKKHENSANREVNEMPRAKRIEATAEHALMLLSVADENGIGALHLHDLLEKSGFDFGLRRAALNHLKINGAIRRERATWVHTKFEKTARHRPPKMPA